MWKCSLNKSSFDLLQSYFTNKYHHFKQVQYKVHCLNLVKMKLEIKSFFLIRKIIVAKQKCINYKQNKNFENGLFSVNLHIFY